MNRLRRWFDLTPRYHDPAYGYGTAGDALVVATVTLLALIVLAVVWGGPVALIVWASR